MANRGGFLFRLLADLVAGLAVAGFVAILGKLNANSSWAISALCILPLVVALASYREPSARRVWIHPLVVMSPALVAVVAAVLTCRGFECGGVAGFLAFIVLFTLLLVVLSLIVFYIKRRITRPSGA